MLSCKQITEKSSAYVDGELSLGQRLQYRLHLMMCHHCRTFINNFNAVAVMLRRAHKAKSHDVEVKRLCQHISSLPRD
ncbi:zf-HC2 domain-containing protein [Motiliproteus sediminis]|uniref:zf-HC2 domain-containing protein n=1 Tax=Motiliproteus sediminis TaxID=1468178 RepID=UPI001AEF5733|nr:zf-HC2 domain-containing protein [Motiliproteus sediminis]